MIPFADSSALVKLYADEAGSSEVRGFERFVVAQIARVEVPAALWKHGFAQPPAQPSRRPS